MKRKKMLVAISDTTIVNRIFTIRDKRVMIDTDLGELYGVSTKRLNEQVKRNARRFPADFMFKLNRQEKQYLIRTVPHLNKIKFSASLPCVFTEHGAVMLASVPIIIGTARSRSESTFRSLGETLSVNS